MFHVCLLKEGQNCVEWDLLQIKPKTKNEIIFSRIMVKIKHLLKGVKTKLS